MSDFGELCGEREQLFKARGSRVKKVNARWRMKQKHADSILNTPLLDGTCSACDATSDRSDAHVAQHGNQGDILEHKWADQSSGPRLFEMFCVCFKSSQ